MRDTIAARTASPGDVQPPLSGGVKLLWFTGYQFEHSREPDGIIPLSSAFEMVKHKYA